MMINSSSLGENALVGRADTPPQHRLTSDTLGDAHDGFRRSCLLCASTSLYQPYPGQLPWLYRCSRCRLGFANPQATNQELAQIYNDEYYQAFGYSDADSTGYRIMQRVRFVYLLRMAERLGGVGRLLDVGSALGDLLRVADERQWEPHGIEPNAFAALRANQLLPGCTWHGKIEDYRLATEPFDLVTCLDVLEHLRRPDQFLRQAATFLRPGGLLLVTTINQDSPWEYWLGPRWVHYHRDHLWYFNPQTLRSFVEAAGLNVLRCGPARKAFNGSYVLEILTHGSDSGLVKRLASLGLAHLPRKLLNQVLWMTEGLQLLARRPE